MITPDKFKKNRLTKEQRFAFWFSEIAQGVKSKSKNHEFYVYLYDVPREFIVQYSGGDYGDELYSRFQDILAKFGWIVTTQGVSFCTAKYIYFHWTSEDVETEELRKEYEKEYKYVTFNNVMWKYGYTDIHTFDKWFDKVANEHDSNPSYYETVHNCLIIPYDEVKKANKSFVKSFTYNINNYENVKTSTLKEPYVEHLELAGWQVEDKYINDKYCLVCH